MKPLVRTGPGVRLESFMLDSKFLCTQLGDSLIVSGPIDGGTTNIAMSPRCCEEIARAVIWRAGPSSEEAHSIGRLADALADELGPIMAGSRDQWLKIAESIKNRLEDVQGEHNDG